MNQTTKSIAIATALAFAPFSANATTVSFGTLADGVTTDSNFEKGVGTDVGTDVRSSGGFIDFTLFDLYAAISVGLNLNSNDFVRTSAQINSAFSYQDITPKFGGLGACSIASNCEDASDSLHSNLGDPQNTDADEVLFFDFSSTVELQMVWFNGDHVETVDFNPSVDVGHEDNALFNIFYSADGADYTRVFTNQQTPTDQDFLDTSGNGEYQYWAVAATGWGPHASYVEAIEFSAVPEPGTLALLGLSLVGLGWRRRKLR